MHTLQATLQAGWLLEVKENCVLDVFYPTSWLASRGKGEICSICILRWLGAVMAGRGEQTTLQVWRIKTCRNPSLGVFTITT